MILKDYILLSASAGVGIVGVGYLFSPEFMYSLYDIEILSVNELSMVRSVFGGLFIAFSILFLVGVIFNDLLILSLMGLVTFMSGLALGRVVSIVIDGVPEALLLGLLLLEVSYSLLGAYLLRNLSKKNVIQKDEVG